ncbi:MAG: membrane lipoprotein lipid attachment site-containing protein [Lactobacillaceae bacterium]|jgi:hypothetical protein|nr:membrane lipoprotein lipid attachment site-containing protein [Lactobacillaceae bacterium]
MKKVLFLIGTILAVSACSSSNTDYETQTVQNDDEIYQRFIDNVSIKEKGPYSITYEYKDIRVDDIAVFAAKYCKETYNTYAHLKSVALHKNNYRLATFHCHDLQQ